LIEAVDVLVVEDEERLRSRVLRALPEMGLTGMGARGVHDARALLARVRAGALLVDIRLGAEDGLAMLESLRAAGDHRPAVVMTAFADVPSAQRAMRCGVADYVTKPFSLDQLERALARACSARPGAPVDDGPGDGGPADDGTFESAKLRAVNRALERNDGNKRKAARDLGISRRTLYNWLERFESEF